MPEKPTASSLTGLRKVPDGGMRKVKRCDYTPHSPRATAARITHPDTVEIYDNGRTDEGTFCYVMELL